jgi:hypothetical protein
MCFLCVLRPEGSLEVWTAHSPFVASVLWVLSVPAAPIGLWIANHPHLALVIQGKEKAGGGAMGIDLTFPIY